MSIDGYNVCKKMTLLPRDFCVDKVIIVIICHPRVHQSINIKKYSSKYLCDAPFFARFTLSFLRWNLTNEMYWYKVISSIHSNQQQHECVYKVRTFVCVTKALPINELIKIALLNWPIYKIDAKSRVKKWKYE